MKARAVTSEQARDVLAGRQTLLPMRFEVAYRGPLVLCVMQPAGEFCRAVCRVDLVNVRPSTPADEVAGRRDRFVWELDSPRAVQEVVTKGSAFLLFDVPDGSVRELPASGAAPAAPVPATADPPPPPAGRFGLADVAPGAPNRSRSARPTARSTAPAAAEPGLF